MRPALKSLLVAVVAASLLASGGIAGAGQKRGGKSRGAITAALPTIADTALARRVRRGDKRIERYRQKHLSRLARGRVASRDKIAAERAIEVEARALGARIRRVADRRPILVILEGPDGVGKTGTIRRLETVFAGRTPVRQVHFGAPPPGETGDWLATYRAELPRAGEEVVIWDRSHYGRVVYDPYYGMVTPVEVRDRYGDIEAFEEQLARDFRVVKVFLSAGGDRLAETIGKREAVAPEKLRDSDYRSFRDRKLIRKLFKQARKNTGGFIKWNVIDMNDRVDGRSDLLDVMARELVDGAR